MRKYHFIGAAVSVTGLVLTVTAGVALASGGDHEDHKTGLCHRTASDSNPYVFIEVDDNALPAHLNDLPGHPPKAWKSAGTWRGVAHAAGDLKHDYLATSAADCSDTPTEPPSTEPGTPADAAYVIRWQEATCKTPEGATFTLTDANIAGDPGPVTFEGPFDGTVHIYADEGHTFADGSTELDVPLTVVDIQYGAACGTTEPPNDHEPGEPTVTKKCVGNALVTKTVDEAGNISTSTVNGAKACQPGTPHEPGQPAPPSVPVDEEGM
jgi:hypothetical protein